MAPWRSWAFAMWVGIPLTAGCANHPASPTDLSGAWGGLHISLTMTDTGTHVEFDCAHGDVPGALRPGAFSVVGTFVREHGGPIREGEDPDAHPALYAGSTSGDRMTLSVRLIDSSQDVGTFTLTRGVAGRVVKCL